MEKPEIDLLAIDDGTITAPAGCGKTHLIAEALKRHAGAKPVLVLTHTNAGVAALRSRLDKAIVSRSRYRLATIDGWAMRLISMFPARSEHDPSILELQNRASDYPAIRHAAANLLHAGHVNDVLSATYDRLVVDEYQDCSDVQHTLVCSASNSLPVCVLGDPMQAIFGFKGNTLVDWEEDVHANFKPAGELSTPHRWVNVGEEKFGRWLLEVRKDLIAGNSIDLSAAPHNVRHVRLDGTDDYKRQLGACLTKAPTADGTVLIMADAKNPVEQRQFASQTPGAVTVENVDLTDLVAFGTKFDLKNPNAVDVIVHFASSVMTNVGANDMLARLESLKGGRARRAASEAEASALAFADSPTYEGAAELLEAINGQSGVRVHRPAILRGAYRMLQLCTAGNGITPHGAAVQVREQSRLIGRPLAKRTVGSTLLLKGLEADVSVILDADAMTAQHLYVAMTRGSRSLVVCSANTSL